jgi:hypothetical protein
MDKPKLLNLTIVALIGIFLLFSAAASQTPQPAPPESRKAYEAVLQIFSATEGTGAGTALPAALSETGRKLKTIYPNSDFRLHSTLFGRITSTLESKAILRDLGDEPAGALPVYAEWVMANLFEGDQGVLQMRTFRFTARIPVPVGPAVEAGRPAFAYESVNAVAQQLNLRPNTPTLVGGISTGRAGAMILLVLTVRSAPE